VATIIKHAERLSSTLLRLADDPNGDKRPDLTISSHFGYVKQVVPTRMIMPLQDALTCTLPSSADTVMSHNPFPLAPVEIHGEEALIFEVDCSFRRASRSHDLIAETEEAGFHWHRWSTVSVPLQAAR